MTETTITMCQCDHPTHNLSNHHAHAYSKVQAQVQTKFGIQVCSWCEEHHSLANFGIPSIKKTYNLDDLPPKYIKLIKLLAESMPSAEKEKEKAPLVSDYVQGKK